MSQAQAFYLEAKYAAFADDNAFSRAGEFESLMTSALVKVLSGDVAWQLDADRIAAGRPPLLTLTFPDQSCAELEVSGLKFSHGQPPRHIPHPVEKGGATPPRPPSARPPMPNPPG